MRIIKRGEKQEERVGRFDCQHCDSIIEAQAGEAHHRHSGYQGSFLYFTCPVCNHGVGIEERKFFRQS
jgi:RNase P subunit RPR2